jgi:hypothetical protein
MAELDQALAPFDEREMLLSTPDKSSRMSAVKLTQSSMVDATNQAREIADARPQLILYSALGAAMLLFTLFTAIGGGVRLFRDSRFPTLSILEAGITAAILVAALATPAVLIFRNLFRATWDNTARVLEALKLVRAPVLAGLGAYGLVALTLRVLETFVLRTQVGIAWPFWDVLLPLAGLLAGATAFFVKRGVGLRALGTTALISVGATLAIGAVAAGAYMRTPVEIAVEDEDAADDGDRKRTKEDKDDAASETPAGDASKSKKPARRNLPQFDTPLQAWGSVGVNMRRGLWQKATDSLEVFVGMDPDGPKDHNVKKAVQQLAVKACVKKTADVCSHVMRLLSEEMGEGGIDVLFELVVTRGGTGATWHASKLLMKDDVIERGSAEVRVAYALRTANNCDKVRELLPQAAELGDHRTARELKIISGPRRQCRARGCCLPSNDSQIKTALETIKDRLH